MARIERNAENWYAVYNLSLKQSDAVTVIDFSTRIVGKPSQDTNVVPLAFQLLCKQNPFECGFRIKPLSDHQNPQRMHHLVWAYQTLIKREGTQSGIR